jgi:hypothetical protein
MIERINKIKKIPSNIWFVLCRIVNLCDIQVHNLGIYIIVYMDIECDFLVIMGQMRV